MQDKVIEGDEAFFTKELSPYQFQVTNPAGDMNELLKFYHDPKKPSDGKDLDWAMAEFRERISPDYLNPGEAHKFRDETWSEFLHGGKFAYTYNNRIRVQLDIIIDELAKHPGTRQAIIEVHNNLLDINSLGGQSRVPCSMHYQLLIREEKVDMIYVMRSSDFLTHFGYDNWLAIKLQVYIAACLDREVGRYTYMTGSLHAYYKDMKAKGIF